MSWLKRSGLAIVWLAAIALVGLLLFELGRRWVPEFSADDAWLSADVARSAYLEFVSFCLTALLIAPLTARIVKWFEEEEWRDARRNARDRLEAILKEILSNYRGWIHDSRHPDELQASLEASSRQHFMRWLSGYLDDFFEAYADEHPSFNAAMHSEASKIRRRLSDLKSAVDRCDYALFNRGSRVEFARHDLDKLRSVAGLPPIPAPSGQPAGDEAAGVGPRGDIPLTDHYFAQEDRLFVDFVIDQRVGSSRRFGARFEPLDVEALGQDWQAFVRASGTEAQGYDLPQVNVAVSEQRRSFASWIETQNAPSYMIDLVLDQEQREVWKAQGEGT